MKTRSWAWWAPGLLLVFCFVEVFPVCTRIYEESDFYCPYGFVIKGVDCYLFIDVPVTYRDAEDWCETHGAHLVNIRDEVEAKDVGQMADAYQWDFYWIGNQIVQGDELAECGGLWDVGEPVNDSSAEGVYYLAVYAPHRLWRSQTKTVLHPFVCQTPACVEGTFRCRNGERCISNKDVCDGFVDCEDGSDESSSCDDRCREHIYGDTGSLDRSIGGGQSCIWVIEGSPGHPLDLHMINLVIQEDVDVMEVRSGTPYVATSLLLKQSTQSVRDTLVHGDNNIIIIRLETALTSATRTIVASWGKGSGVLPCHHWITATDEWTSLTSPWYLDEPLGYVCDYTVSSQVRSLITMEVVENDLGAGFEFSPDTLSNVNGQNTYPEVYVSIFSTFSFSLISAGSNGPEKFQARVKKGCTVNIIGSSGFIVPPNSVAQSRFHCTDECIYTITAPVDASRNFQIVFDKFSMANADESLKIYDGVGQSTLIDQFSLNKAADNDTVLHTSSPAFTVVFSSCLVLSTHGFFNLTFELDCPAVTNTANMIITSTSDEHYGSEVTLSCSKGYAFAQEEYVDQTEIVIRCGSGGKWNVSRLPSCAELWCGVPPDVPNGIIVGGTGSAKYGETVTYLCGNEYFLEGDDTIVCGNGSKWSAAPVCGGESPCPDPDSITNGNFTKNGTVRSLFIQYYCDQGYELIGSKFSQCMENGSWSSPQPPVCSPIKCPLPEVSRGELNVSDPVDFGQPVTVQCNPGYVINGTDLFFKPYTCQHTRDFTFSSDVCVDEDECETQNACSGDHQICKNTEGSYICLCEERYQMSGNGDCEVINRCVEKTSGCDLTNGECFVTNEGEDYECDCNYGFVLFTENGTSGRYIPPEEDGITPGDVYYLNHTCVPKVCDHPGNITDGQLLTLKTSFDFGENVRYTCNFGYGLVTDEASSEELTCDGTGWDKNPPTCERKTCQSPELNELVSEVYFNSTPIYAGNKVVVECILESTGDRYNKTLFCAYDMKSNTFRLQGDSPLCPAIDCGQPDISHASVDLPDADRRLGSSFTLTCDPGFVVFGVSTKGNQTVTCEKNGRWGLGTLTCAGPRCTDPGTPGGMSQTSASFEVNATVTYSCKRSGFQADPESKKCIYDNLKGSPDWDGEEPVCADVQDPVFEHCPEEPVRLKLYSNASSVPFPSATDNSGLVMVTVSPEWFSRDVPLDHGTYPVTFTAKDSAENIATCSVTVQVNDPEQFPTFQCPDYLLLHVNESSAELNLTSEITFDSALDLAFHPAQVVTVSLSTIGQTEFRVTATSIFGFQKQCAFIVDIKADKCLSTYIESDVASKNAGVSCSSSDDSLSCTVTCKNGFVFQDGTTSMDYTCTRKNVWLPPLPARSCVATKAATPRFVLAATYNSSQTGINSCDMETALHVNVHGREAPDCVVNADDVMRFTVAEVSVQHLSDQKVNVTVTLDITNERSKVSPGDILACQARLSESHNYNRDLLVLDPGTVNCTEMNPVKQTLTLEGDHRFVKTDYCKPGYIQHEQTCVPCEPGYYFTDGKCAECADRDYQDKAGQTTCKPCENGTRSVSPRLSSSQCLGCTGGFYLTNNECHACKENTYNNLGLCSGCADKTTWGTEGMTACVDACDRGWYPSHTGECAPCPLGYYKSRIGNTACTACANDKTTAGTGTTTEDCVDVVDRTDCGPNGVPETDEHISFCRCADGYSGETCKEVVNACDSSPCYNGGECSSQSPSNFTCSCGGGFTGARCETDMQNDCESSTYCADPSFCRDLINEVDCVCPDSQIYINSRCETSSGSLCTADPCENNARCEESANGARTTCICPPGFTGKKCEVNIDECALNTDGCLHGGSCVDGNNSYTCNCSLDYDGDHCENVPDFCRQENSCQGNFCYHNYTAFTASCVCESPYESDGNGGCSLRDACEDNPCVNGTCSSVEGSANCDCQTGYKGSLCQHDIDDCSSNPCGKDGKCIDQVNNYTCQCNPGYAGERFCENIDECSTSNCTFENRGSCRDLENDYLCTCEHGFTGKDCQTNIDACLSLPCRHGGTCIDSAPGQYTCSCAYDWTGDNCEELRNFCTSDTCNGNGECRSLQDSYLCICDSGTYGKNCEIEPTQCDVVNHCVPGAECVDVADGAICHCPQNYTGSSCNLIKDFCSDDPCENGGTCVQEKIGYTCLCPEGYSGRNCSLDPCAAVRCPANTQCLVTDAEAFCDCGVGQFKSGSTCKDVMSDFDIYFVKPGPAIRSCQPFRLYEEALSVTFFAALLKNSDGFVVEFRLRNGTTVLAFDRENVKIGTDDPVQMRTVYNDEEYVKNQWNQVSFVWLADGTINFYLHGVDVVNNSRSVTSAPFPPLQEPIFIYIGAGVTGYISQLYVWQRPLEAAEFLDIYDHPQNIIEDDLVFKWGCFHRFEPDVLTQAVSPSIVHPTHYVCEDGLSGDVCSYKHSDKKSITINWQCPNETTGGLEDVSEELRSVCSQANASNYNPCANLTYGAHRLVFLATDDQNNVAFCRFSAYIQRENQSCSNTEGLDSGSFHSCQDKGIMVQCPNNNLAPLSPNIMSCGKLGSYNLEATHKPPRPILCGGIGRTTYKGIVTLRYKVETEECNFRTNAEVIEHLDYQAKMKVKSITTDLCPLSDCDDIIEVHASCDGGPFVTANITLAPLESTFVRSDTNNFVAVDELLQYISLEEDIVDISEVHLAVLVSSTPVLKPVCEAGYGAVGDVCVECSQGSFANMETGKCQWCPVGSRTESARQTQCSPCPEGETTLYEGALECFKNCSAGSYYSDEECQQCPNHFYQPEGGQRSCLACPSEKETEHTGADSQDLCLVVCPPGQESLDNTCCTECKRGYYRTDSVADRFADCTPCSDSNFTTPGTGSRNESDCYIRLCSAGHYRNDSDSECYPCPADQYQPERVQTECIPCPGDTTTLGATGSHDICDCVLFCDEGHTQSLTSNVTCELCEEDHYKNHAGPGVCLECTGNYTSGPDRTQCDILFCDRGFEYKGASVGCMPCDPGQYKHLRGNTLCSPCPINTTTTEPAATECAETYCDLGFYSPDDSLPCLPCPKGQYKDTAGNHDCTLCDSGLTTEHVASRAKSDCSVVFCPAGWYAVPPERKECEPCAHGQYQPSRGSTACDLCAEDQTTLHINSTSEQDCIPVCIEGEYVDTSSRTCEKCHLGSYNPQAGSMTETFTHCLNCSAGWTTRYEGSYNADECDIKDCKPGFFRSEGVGCEICPMGKYQPLGGQLSCLECPLGETTLKTGRQDERACVNACGSDRQYNVHTKACDPCPIGFYPTRIDEMVNCVKCAEDYTTLKQGDVQCIKEDGVPRPTPTEQIKIRICISLKMSSCSNRVQIRAAITNFVSDILQRTDDRFPTLCSDQCVDQSDLVFEEGCLEGSDSTEQDLYFILNNQSHEIQHSDTGKILHTLDVVRNAFYDVQPEQPKLDEDQITFQEVKCAYVQCSPGKSSPNHECRDCPSGAFSPEGLECSPCPLNSFQNSTGQVTCLSCPDMNYTTYTGAVHVSNCIRKCDEPKAGTTYCSGHGTCEFDNNTLDGVRCVCDSNHKGDNCFDRRTFPDARADLIIVAGVTVGVCLIIIILIVVVAKSFYSRHKRRKKAASGGEPESSITNPFSSFMVAETPMYMYRPPIEGPKSFSQDTESTGPSESSSAVSSERTPPSRRGRSEPWKEFPTPEPEFLY